MLTYFPYMTAWMSGIKHILAYDKIVNDVMLQAKCIYFIACFEIVKKRYTNSFNAILITLSKNKITFEVKLWN